LYFAGPPDGVKWVEVKHNKGPCHKIIEQLRLPALFGIAVDFTGEINFKILVYKNCGLDVVTLLPDCVFVSEI
jgi:hypothetical protein